MWPRTLVFVCLFLSRQARCGKGKRYDRDKLLKVYPETRQHAQFLADLDADSQTGVDLWTDVAHNKPVTVQVPANELPGTLMKFNALGMRHEIIRHDVQGLVDEQLMKNHLAGLKSDYDVSRYTFDRYMTYTEIVQWIDNKVANCNMCTKISIGSSFEGRDLPVVKVSAGAGKTRGFWIDGGIHAREWISPATVLFMLDRITNDYGSDSVATQMLNRWDFYFFPVMNADGYVYTHTTDRMWRKTRNNRVDDITGCIGTDANRNFDFQWMTIGASSDPCSNTFAGPEPYSEPEALAVRNYVLTTLAGEGMTLDAFITTHSYGQYFLTPYGYSFDGPPNESELIAAGEAAAGAIASQPWNTQYTVGPASLVLYPSSGTSRDWARGGANIRWVYTIELRDTGLYGFILPPEQIVPTATETWAGIKAMATYIINNS